MDLRKAESNFSDMAKLLELICLNCFGLVGWLVGCKPKHQQADIYNHQTAIDHRTSVVESRTG